MDASSFVYVLCVKKKSRHRCVFFLFGSVSDLILIFFFYFLFFFTQNQKLAPSVLYSSFFFLVWTKKNTIFKENTIPNAVPFS